MEFQINNVASTTASITVESSWRIEVERGAAVLMVRQRAATHKPCFPAERRQVRVAPSDILNGYDIADSLAASVKTVRGVRWVML
jgi:hypothetical protein